MARLDVEVAADVTGTDAIEGMAGSFGNLERIGTGAMERIGHKITDFATNLISSGIQSVIGNIGDSITLASDKAESAGKANKLFGDSYGIVEAASRNAATTVGLSSGAYLEQVGILGNLTTNLGYTGAEAAAMSVDMLTLAADMGSFNNASTEDVTAAMGAAFRGETEPIRAYGVFLDDDRVKAEATKRGLYDGVGALDANAKAQATYSLILQQTTTAQGDFADTATGYANSTKIAAAEQEEAWTAFGEALMPLATAIVPLITDAVKGLVGVLGILADNAPVVIAVLAPLGVMIAATVVPPFIAWALATLAATWPLIAISAAVGVLFVALRELGIIDFIVGLLRGFADVLSGAVNAAVRIVQGVLNGLRPIFDIVGRAVGVLSGLFGTAFGFIADTVGAVMGGMVKGIEAAWAIITGVFRAAQAFIGGVVVAIAGAFTTLLGIVRGIVDGITGTFHSIVAGVVRAVQDVAKWLGGMFQPLADGINKAVTFAKDIWNGFVRFWNGFELVIPAVSVGGFQITPQLVFGLPDLPRLAAGGIVTSPTVALLGESGAEAVVPLTGRNRMTGATVNIYTGVGDPVAIGREVRLALDAYERASGTA